MSAPNAMTTRSGGKRLVADGHVHLYECYPTAQFFDCGWRNLARGAHQLGLAAGSWEGALLFVESARQSAFSRLCSQPSVGNWRIDPAGEPESLRLVRSDGAQLLVIGGFQVATREGLEVLAIGTLERAPDGLPIDETLTHVRAAGAVAIIPWGFGKWTLRRGRLLRDLILRSTPQDFLLGDNGGRPAIGARPPLFDLATQRGFRIVPGSDPLPFPDQVERVGSFGFALPSWNPGTAPAASLRRRLTTPGVELAPFGELTRLWEFGAAQLRMHALKRFG